MYLKIGGAIRPFVEADIQPSYQNFYDGRRVLYKVGITLRIEGRIVLQQNASERNMSVAIQVLLQHFRQSRPDIVLLESDGITPTPISFTSANCLQGPDVLDLALESNEGKVYSTSQPYSATVYLEQLTNSAANPIIEFRETIDDSGEGGFERILVGGAINFPEEQIARQFAPYRYIQQGYAVGLLGYPSVPPPIWPGALKRQRPRITKEGPTPTGRVLTNWRIAWAWEYESAYELFGNPHYLT